MRLLVTRFPDQEALFPAGCSRERTAGLHTQYAVPEVILIYLGTNDWANGVFLEIPPTEIPGIVPELIFRNAYDSLDGIHPNVSGMETIAALTICELLHPEIS